MIQRLTSNGLRPWTSLALNALIQGILKSVCYIFIPMMCIKEKLWDLSPVQFHRSDQDHLTHCKWQKYSLIFEFLLSIMITIPIHLDGEHVIHHLKCSRLMRMFKWNQLNHKKLNQWICSLKQSLHHLTAIILSMLLICIDNCQTIRIL